MHRNAAEYAWLTFAAVLPYLNGHDPLAAVFVFTLMIGSAAVVEQIPVELRGIVGLHAERPNEVRVLLQPVHGLPVIGDAKAKFRPVIDKLR